VIEVYLKILPRHLSGDTNELLLFGASKLKEISFNMHVTSLEAEGDFIQYARYWSENRHSITGRYGIFLFTITYRIGAHTTSLLAVPIAISIRVKWPQCETYYSFYSKGLSRCFITLIHSTHHTYGTSYPDFVHRFLCKENTRFWILDLLPPSSEGIGFTYLVLTLMSLLLIWALDSALLNYLASD
jgi:hypothetical protein